ncbi:hypothetical protein [Microvirga yunnanensis]|uniref:hypothetical protein n=1 Tax=Microvirga yunnanensis TaxID=2953740 RepID=UPI00359F8F6E
MAIWFWQAPCSLFRDTDVERMYSDWMILHIQPGEGVALDLAPKRSSPSVGPGNVKLEFAYADSFRAICAAGYETLIYDCQIGDATLFQRQQYRGRLMSGPADKRRGGGRSFAPRSTVCRRQQWSGLSGRTARSRRSRVATR